MKKIIFLVLCLALLPFAASSQLGGGQPPVVIQAPPPVVIQAPPPAGAAIGGDAVANQNQGVPGDAGVQVNINVFRAEDAPIPVGRRSNCANLTGPSGMLKSQAVKVGQSTYTTCFGWDIYGSPAKLVDPAGFLTEFQYDLSGRPTLIRDAQGEEQQYTYNANSQVQQVVQTNNFNPNNEPVNRSTVFTYDSLGNFFQSQIANGDTSRMRYDLDEQFKAAIGPDNILGNFAAYDGLSRIESMGVGVINATGDPIVEPLGRVRYQYDDVGRISSVSDGAMHWTQFAYDSFGRIQRITYPDNTSLFNNYDDAGRVTWREMRDRVGNALQRTEIDYDNIDQPTEIRISKPGNNTAWKTHWTYQNNGLDVIVDQYVNNSKIGTSTQHLDNFGRLKSIDLPGSGAINSTYDSAGRLERVSHSVHGLLTRYQYDALGRVQFVRDGLNNITGFGYNGLGQMTNFYPPVGAQTKFIHDVNNRTLRTETGSSKTHFNYDAGGRLQTQSYGNNPGGLSGMGFAYQRESGLTTRVNAGQTIKMDVLERDLNGQLKRWRNANGVNFTQDYDVQGRPTLLTAEKNGGTQYRLTSYHNDGREQISESWALPPDRFGEVVGGPGSYSQNIALRTINRLLGRPTYDDRLKSVVWFTYDPAGNVIEEQSWIAGRWLRSTTTFGATAGNNLLTTLTYPSDFKMERTTDQAGRLTRVNGRQPDGRFAGQANFDYVANSPRLDKIRYGADAQQRFAYDAAGRIITSTIAKTPRGGVERIIGRTDYKYSPAENLIAKKEQVSPIAGQNLVNAFTSGYDDVGRVAFWSAVSAQTADGVANNAASAPANGDAVQRFFYNQRSDRTIASTKDVPGALTGSANTQRSFVYTLRADGVLDSAQQRPCWYNAQGAEGGCAANPPAVAITFNPDADGNLTSRIPAGAPGQTYEYDLFGRLITVLDPTSQTRRIQYNYDGLGRLISRVVTERNNWVKEQHYIWSGDSLIEIREVTIRNASGEVTTEIIYSYLFGLDSNDIIAAYDRRWVRYHHNHPDGSVFMLTNEGDVTQWYRYSPFGETQVVDWIQNVATQRPLSESKTLRLFGGALFDPITGFYFPGGWYDSVHGQSF